MFKTKFTLLMAMLLATMSAGCSKQISFQQEIQPLLQQKCAQCHLPGGAGYAGAGYVASGFSVDSYQSVMKGTKFGPVIVPGSSVSSTLIALLEHRANPTINMPRNPESGKADHIAPQNLDLIKQWIDQGAKNN